MQGIHHLFKHVTTFRSCFEFLQKVFLGLMYPFFVCALGDFLVFFAPVLRQIARYLPHHRSENASILNRLLFSHKSYVYDMILKKMILCIRKQKIIFDRDSNKKEISFDLFVTIVYFCSNPMPIIPDAEGSGGIHIHKKALLDALVLTIQESRKFKQLVKNKATGTPQGCFICTARSVPYCIIRERVDYIQTSAWGFRRCSFRLTGQCESL